MSFGFSKMFKKGTEPENVAKIDLKWPLGDLRGQSWPLISKITIASDSLTPKTYKHKVELPLIISSSQS